MLGAFACGAEDREDVCVPNETVSCACAGQTAPGAQTCNEGGSAFGNCRCCSPGARRSCGCSTAGKIGQQDCNAEGEWGGCYNCQ
jgi:hypothetical protein